MTHFASDDALRDFLASPLISDEQKAAIRAELAERTAQLGTAYGILQDGEITWSDLDDAADAVSRADDIRQLVRMRGPVEVLAITREEIVDRHRERTITPTGAYAAGFTETPTSRPPRRNVLIDRPQGPGVAAVATADIARLAAEHDQAAERHSEAAHYARTPAIREEEQKLRAWHERTATMLRALGGGPA